MSSTQNTDVEALIATRIQARRLEVGMSQENLSKALGLTLHQVQEYEKGSDRVSSELLLNIADVLECNITQFFEDLTQRRTAASAPFATFMTTKEGVAIVKAMLKISDHDLRRKVIEIAEKFAET